MWLFRRLTPKKMLATGVRKVFTRSGNASERIRESGTTINGTTEANPRQSKRLGELPGSRPEPVPEPGPKPESRNKHIAGLPITQTAISGFFRRRRRTAKHAPNPARASMEPGSGTP